MPEKDAHNTTGDEEGQPRATHYLPLHARIKERSLTVGNKCRVGRVTSDSFVPTPVEPEFQTHVEYTQHSVAELLTEASLPPGVLNLR
ncbi:hypothetical protein RRG08_004546 [Elysia crispata]|uniref:Uncharacterized protein n=1 Tax=Elysia crispata TaxID=231223 RepID=A0AAE1EC77_9GAST|nr:hypothetical protein RRG08_004546 [Elysia crispata]